MTLHISNIKLIKRQIIKYDITTDAGIYDLNDDFFFPYARKITCEILGKLERIKTEAAISSSITLRDLWTPRLCTTSYTISFFSAFLKGDNNILVVPNSC